MELENITIKLHYIKPNIEEWESANNSCQQYEAKLSWFRIAQCTYQTNPWIFDDKKQPAANIYKRGMQKPDTNNQTLPQGLPSRGEQQKKMQ